MSSFASLLTWDELTSVPQRIFDDIRDPAGTYSFDIHFGDGELREHAHCACLSRCSWDELPSRELVVLSEDFPVARLNIRLFGFTDGSTILATKTQSAQNLLEVMEV